MKHISILGSTGSIGTTTLAVAKHLGIEVVAIGAHSNIDLLQKQIIEHRPKVVAVYDTKQAAKLRKRCPAVEILEGEEGMCACATHLLADVVIMGIVGIAALPPTLAAIEVGKKIGLANKEVLVSAGEFITSRAKACGASIIPVDSEHSAIFQCLEKMRSDEVGRIILTASGGPFRNYSKEQLTQVTLKQALNHPTWTMGPKVTVDSSTLVNKGLEMIEAYWLFGHIPHVVIHPQSIIHSMVEAIDGTLFAQMHPHDMSYPIQYAITHPKRAASRFTPFDFTKYPKLEFMVPDSQKFPTLELAKQCLVVGKSLACYLNAANEILVTRFLEGKISWLEITTKLEKLLEQHNPYEVENLEAVMAVDAMGRMEAQAK